MSETTKGSRKMNEPKGNVVDKYDKEVAYLTGNPGKIPDAWSSPDINRGGLLFQWCTLSGGEEEHPDSFETCGCLTQVRGGGYSAWTDKLTEQIQNDVRIPLSESGITVDDLPVFAEWQRRLDKELGRNMGELTALPNENDLSGGDA